MKIECTEYQLSILLQSVSERLDYLDKMIEDEALIPPEAKDELKETKALMNELNEISLEKYGYEAL
jgi:hypothetical protein